MSRARFHDLSIQAIHREAEDAVAITLTIPEALREEFAFLPGQSLTVRRPGDADDQRRSYSVCSAPGEESISIAVREIPGGRLSPWLNREVRVGTTLQCLPPDGQFCLKDAGQPARHLLLIGAGSGITPLLSIARTALGSSAGHRVTLLYGNRSVASTMFREALEDLKDRHLQHFDLHYLFSREAQDIPLHEGRLDRAKIETFLGRLVPVETIDDVYLCGPNAMLDEVTASLRAAGVPQTRIHLERFGAPDLAPDTTLTAPPAITTASIKLIIDGKTRTIPLTDARTSVLEAARAAGLDLPFSCRTGVCATCRAKVISGEVQMTRNFALLEEDLAAGIILTCQAHPVTSEVTVSFDER